MNKYLKARKVAQKSHFRRRVRERLGFHLTEDELKKVRDSIQQKTSLLLTRHSLRNSIWRVRIGNRDIIVVYDEETNEPATVLTESMWQERSVCNSPVVKDNQDLQIALGDHPAAKVLRDFKKEK